MRIIQVSDTHLSREHRDFAQNLAVVHDAVARLEADLVVHTGDLSMNGAVATADLEDAVAWQRGLPQESLVLPGNHDVGDLPEMRSDQVLDDHRLAAYRAIVGEDRWARDLSGWRLVGLNAMLCATGHPEERRQLDWLEAVLETSAPVALFLHKPLFVDDPQESARGYWTIPPVARGRILDRLARADVRLIASGHLHVARRFEPPALRGAVSHVWAPSAAFVCGPSQTGVPGERRIGFAVHDFGPEGVQSRFVFPVAAQPLTIDAVIERIYPRPMRARSTAERPAQSSAESQAEAVA